MEAGGLGKAMESAAAEKAETVIILENDLYRRAEKEHVDRFLDSITNIVVIDSFSNQTTEHADVLLPAGTFAESSGSLVNSEGRAQHFFKVFVPEGPIEEGWQWLREMLSIAQKPEGENWKTVYDIAEAMAKGSDIFGPLISAAPAPEFREAGQKVPRQSHRYSGRTAMTANRNMHEPPPSGDPDSPLAFSMEGYSGMPPGSLLPRYWYPAWNSVQSLGKFQIEAGGPLRDGNPGRRLIGHAGGNSISFFDDIPGGFIQENSRWLFVPCYHIFGSEELSSMAPAIAGLSPKPYLALNENDASRLGLKDGGVAKIMLAEKEYSLTVRTGTGLPQGIAGLPAGMPPFKGITLPCPGSISKGKVTL
jgi:NADH-quinone oxidoreductase subunit G